VKVTLIPERVQPVELLESVLTMLSPDVAEAPGEYDPPAPPELGAAETEIVFAEYTLMLCWTWAAAA
jgi:hypothetical protein